MKKLVALMLVFGLASLANAMTLRISVNGDPAPPDSEIWLQPSETIRLDIYSPDGYGAGSMADTYFALVVDPRYGIITGGVVTAAAPPDSGIYGPSVQTDVPGWIALPDDGPYGSILNVAGTAVDPGTYIDDFIFHCEGILYETVVSLYSSPDFGASGTTLEDQIIIHNIPEPATMALLSLGGLFLLRRRK
jgi:hypothetical protein